MARTIIDALNDLSGDHSAKTIVDAIDNIDLGGGGGGGADIAPISNTFIDNLFS